MLCAAYPRGIDNQSLAQCCAACNADATCTSFVLVPPVGTCWPLVSYDHLVPAPDRTFGGTPPPPPPPVVPPPPDWSPRIAASDMLYSSEDWSVPRSQLPMVGNGMLATQIMSDSIWVSGLFNGFLSSVSHRARIPATSAVAAPGNQSGAALDLREATYFRRSTIDPSPPGSCTAASTQSCSNANARITVEQRWFAHRALPSVMVMEVQVLPDVAPGAARTPDRTAASDAADAPPYAMLRLVNAPGANSSDINFVALEVPPGADYSVANGSTVVAESSYSSLQAACVLTTDLPASGALLVPASSPFDTAFYYTVIRTSVETPPSDLLAAVQADLAQAQALAAQGKLRSSHVAEWAETVWTAGFATDRPDVARVVNSSVYAIVSSFRNDRPFSSAPGGLTAGYNGHSFASNRALIHSHPRPTSNPLLYRPLLWAP